jgi:hypothetical protein
MKKYLLGTKGLKLHEVATAIYVTRSICECGFPILNETVPLLRKYRVVMDLILEMQYYCGGCGKLKPVPCVLTEQGDTGIFFNLPLGIFNPKEEWEL